jgi:serine/threonine protein phosphatase 1
MRTLVFGDIHGGYRALVQAMERANVTQDDHLIFLGDYVDGWSESDAVIDELMRLKKEYKKVTLIRGNHDDLVQQWLEGKTMSPKWLQHGGQSTIDCYEKRSAQEIKEHIEFYKTFEDYYLDDKNRFFCHAGFQNLNGPDYEWHSTAFYWDRTLWEMACAMREDLKKEDPLYPKRLQLFEEIYIGHTPTTRINSFVPVNKANIWNLDTGAAFKGSLTVMDVDTKEFWQSDTLPSLYPDEIGRN